MCNCTKNLFKLVFDTLTNLHTSGLFLKQADVAMMHERGYVSISLTFFVIAYYYKIKLQDSPTRSLFIFCMKTYWCTQNNSKFVAATSSASGPHAEVKLSDIMVLALLIVQRTEGKIIVHLATLFGMIDDSGCILYK